MLGLVTTLCGAFWNPASFVPTLDIAAGVFFPQQKAVPDVLDMSKLRHLCFYACLMHPMCFSMSYQALFLLWTLPQAPFSPARDGPRFLGHVQIEKSTFVCVFDASYTLFNEFKDAPAPSTPGQAGPSRAKSTHQTTQGRRKRRGKRTHNDTTRLLTPRGQRIPW